MHSLLKAKFFTLIVIKVFFIGMTARRCRNRQSDMTPKQGPSLLKRFIDSAGGMPVRPNFPYLITVKIFFNPCGPEEPVAITPNGHLCIDIAPKDIHNRDPGHLISDRKMKILPNPRIPIFIRVLRESHWPNWRYPKSSRTKILTNTPKFTAQINFKRGQIRLINPYVARHR